MISISSKGFILSSAYASASIYVAHGVIIAAVKGGYQRSAAVDKSLILDASISSDEDTKKATLLYSWSCSISSTINFHSACTFMTGVVTTSSVLTLPASQMDVLTKYSFLVLVTSTDGRAATQSVLVTPILAGAPTVYSSNKALQVNQNEAMVIPGLITGNVSTVATWTAFFQGLPVTLDRVVTPVYKVFTASEMRSSISYPLGVSSDTFVGGRTYSFRLSAYPLGYASLEAHTDIVLYMNSPPVGGYTTVSPLKGFALSTDFMMATTGWSDDISNYPLSYNFAYQLAVSSRVPALALSVLSPLPYTSSQLPPGLIGGTYIS